MIRGHPPHPRLVLRRGPQPYPHRARSREHDPATPLRHRAHQGARARRRRDHASLGQESATGSRLPQDDRQRLPSRSTRLSAPCGSLPRASPPALGTRGTTAHARRPRQWTVMPKGSAIRPPKHGEIRHRAAERAAMKATRRVLDARDSTPTIRTNLPYIAPMRHEPIMWVDQPGPKNVGAQRWSTRLPISAAIRKCSSRPRAMVA